MLQQLDLPHPLALLFGVLLSRIKVLRVAQRPLASVPAEVGLGGGVLGASEVCSRMAQARVRNLKGVMRP